MSENHGAQHGIILYAQRMCIFCYEVMRYPAVKYKINGSSIEPQI